MKTKEMKEIIKAEIRVYMRMLRDMKRAMIEQVTPDQLRKIALYYNVPKIVVDRLAKREVIIGFRIGHGDDKNELYKGQTRQEHTPFNFSFTCQLNYKLADALRMYAIYDRHIDQYKTQMQAEVIREITKEDELMRPHMEFCNRIACEGTMLCSDGRCKVAKGGRPDDAAMKSLPEKKIVLTRWQRVCLWFRSFKYRITSKF